MRYSGILIDISVKQSRDGKKVNFELLFHFLKNSNEDEDGTTFW